MTSGEPNEAAPAQTRRQWIHTRRRGMLITKIIVAIAVALGLVYAVRSASQNWTSQKQKIESQISELDERLLLEADPVAQSQIRQTRASLRAQLPSWQNVRGDVLVVAAIVYALALVPPAIVLRMNCRLFGQPPRWSTTIAAQLLGHVGKYVPGKAMVVILRVGALRRDQISPMAGTVSVFSETFVMMAAGAAMAGVITMMIPVPAWINLTAVAMALAATAPTLPPIMKKVVSAVVGKKSSMQSPGSSTQNAGQAGSEPQWETARASMNWKWFLSVWACSVVSWLLIGGSFALTIGAMPGLEPLPTPAALFWLATAAMGLAMAVGFASLLPGGAGVRELVLITILGISLDPSRALLAAIAARIMFIVVEAVLAAGSWLWLRTDRQKGVTIADSPREVP